MDELTVLVVDDDPMVLDTTCEMIATMARVVPASTPNDAIDVLRSGVRVDVLMCDLTMYPLSGVELGKRAQQLRPGLSVVLTSGYAAESIDLPPDWRFMPKPYGINCLQSVLLDN
jgi:DNA-binding NtrC family response regulator